MDSLQLAVAAYIAENGSIDIATYTKLSDLYTLEISDDTKRMALYGRKRDAKNASGEINRRIRDVVHSELEQNESKNPITKVKAGAKKELSSQQLKQAEDAYDDKQAKMYRTACLIAKSAMSTAKVALKKCLREASDNDIDSIPRTNGIHNTLSRIESYEHKASSKHRTSYGFKVDCQELRETCSVVIETLRKTLGLGSIGGETKKEINVSIDKLQNAIKMCDDILK